MLINEKFPLKTNPAKDGIFDFPIFHYSMCEAETQASENPFIVSKLYKFRDV
jgi:hypothetical protein